MKYICLICIKFDKWNLRKLGIFNCQALGIIIARSKCLYSQIY